MEKTPRHSADGSEEMTRRGFISKAFAAAATAGVGKVAWDAWHEYHDEIRESYAPELSLRPAPRPEREPTQSVEQFEAEVAGYEAQTYLRHDEVLFLDDKGAPIGEPYRLEPFDGVDPGAQDENGLFVDGVSGEWLRAVRTHIRDRYPDAEFTIDPDNYLPRQLNMTATFARAVTLHETEPGLVEGITSGTISRYLDIICYFGDKSVVGAETMSRVEYVRTAAFSDQVPESIAQQLSDIMPGLCAQESGFNNAVVSRSGAKGIFQFMPNVWEQDYGRSDEDYNSLRIQTETAGEHFSRVVRQLNHFATSENLQVLRAHCESDEQYEQEVYMPLMINAYNAGARRMGEAVTSFVEQLKQSDVVEVHSGHDLFLQIADHAYDSNEGTLQQYGPEARAYVPQVIARARVLAREYGYKTA